MFSLVVKRLPNTKLGVDIWRKVESCRFLYNSASDQHNIRKFKRIKRLAYTFLFGGTFLIALWAKKNRRSTVFDEAKLVTNTNYHKNFKLYEYKGIILPSFVMNNLSKIQNFICNENDVIVVSFPKTGIKMINYFSFNEYSFFFNFLRN